MKIETKFKIRQEVYIVFKEDNESFIKILKDVIEEISIAKDGTKYYGKKICEEFNEDDIVDINDEKGLANKIKELSE